MRNRIKLMRALLVERLHERVPGADFRFMLAQRGMFSYSGLTKAQVHTLRDEYSVYAIDTGRICVAALNNAQRRRRGRRDRQGDRLGRWNRRAPGLLTGPRIIRYNARLSSAGIAQLVERNLAKVEVASSRLVSRSSFCEGEPVTIRMRLSLFA